MSRDFFEARRHIARAREALQRGDRESAWQLGKQAALVAPEMEDAWLVLTASDPDPREALAYARQALKINPGSTRACRGVEWALARVKQNEAGNVLVKQATTLGMSINRQGIVANFPQRASSAIIPKHQYQISARKRVYLALLLGAGCLAVGFASFFAWPNPAFASIVNSARAPATQENLWAFVDIAKPTITPIDVSIFAPPHGSSDTTAVPTDIPASPEDELPTVTYDATATPGTMTIEIVDENSVSQSSSPGEAPSNHFAESNDERWIDVNLSEQRVYVYEGEVLVNSFLVSTGLPATPTVTGEYKIRIKVRIQDMSGPGYYLRDVPYVMYFYEDYGFHGTYWHNNFGTPMSRGCVNLTIDDAAWLYNWASVGTVVNIHY